MDATVKPDVPTQIRELIGIHHQNADELVNTSLGGRMKTFAIELSESILRDVIPTLEYALHCHQILDELTTWGLEKSDVNLYNCLVDGINTATPWLEHWGVLI